jgi:hypothetical protein
MPKKEQSSALALKPVYPRATGLLIAKEKGCDNPEKSLIHSRIPTNFQHCEKKDYPILCSHGS